MQTFGLGVLWQQGDAVSRATLLILLGMSCLSWTLILIKSLDLLRFSRQAARVDTHFWESHDLESGAPLLGQPGAPFHALYLAATQAMAHHTAHPQHLHTRLDPARFMRVHRCFIVNLQGVSGLGREGSKTTLLLKGGREPIPVSRNALATLREALGLSSRH